MQHLGRAYVHTYSAAGTFGVIDHRNTVDHFHALFRAVFYAEFTLYAPGFAVPGYHGFVHVQVGTNGLGAFLIPWDCMEDVHGTFINAGLAAIAFIGINNGKAVFHVHGAELADRNTIAEALAAPGTTLGASH